jgi:hypothetical protein
MRFGWSLAAGNRETLTKKPVCEHPRRVRQKEAHNDVKYKGCSQEP